MSLLALAAALPSGYYATKATSWAVMTDELQVVRLAMSVGDSLSPLPAIHGVYYGANSQLYPLLLAPLYEALPAPAAATAAHALNALLLASAAWPAFLLARSVSGSRATGYAAAALTVFTPWMVLSSTLLTENAAYPAFVWAVYLCHRTLVWPSAGRDVAALAGLGIAFLARTQLLALAVALPAALVVHAVGYAGRRGETRRGALPRLVSRHRVLAGAYLGGALCAYVLALTGRLGGVVGNYSTTFTGDLFPDGFWRSAAAHFDRIAVGVGLLPAALAASWTLTAIVRPARNEAHAFASLLAVLAPLLTFEVTSFDVRFTPGAYVQDRYLFYLVPLLAVAAAAWLTQRTHLRLRLLTLAGACGGLVALLAFVSYSDTVNFWAAPGGAFGPALANASGRVGLSTTLFLQLASVVSVVVVAATSLRAPRLALAGATTALACFGAFEAGYVLDRYVEPTMTRPNVGASRDWIDAAVPSGRPVALVPGGLDGATPWWEAELWNKRVERVLRVDQGPTFTPFPADELAVDYEQGTLTGPQPADRLVVSSTETRFHVLESKVVARNRPLRLVRVRRPYRLAWATRGLTPDGWTRPNKLATVRLYGHDRGGRRRVELTLAAPRSAPQRVDFALRGGGAVEYASVDPGGARPPVSLTVCVPADGYSDVWLTSNGETIDDGRAVALHVDRLDVTNAGAC